MPMPTDEKLLALSESLLQAFDAIFGVHPGFRPAHAKGLMLSGHFVPDPAAASLTRAPHVHQPKTPVLVRFSNSSGVPLIPDTDPNANPRGIGVRFALGDRVHTDIIGHSTDGFPTHTGDEFLQFLRAIASSNLADLKGSPLEAFLGSHPAALAFVQAPKPAPSSFARESYFGVTAMQFTDAQGKSRYGRYRVIPEAGNEHLDDAAVKLKAPDYLFAEIAERVSKAPVSFRIVVQLAEEGDVVDDATKHWPESRTLHPFGTLTLTSVLPDSAVEQKHIIFDPIPRVDGIEPSEDPLLEVRAAVYLLSGRRRRSA